MRHSNGWLTVLAIVTSLALAGCGSDVAAPDDQGNLLGGAGGNGTGGGAFSEDLDCDGEFVNGAYDNVTVKDGFTCTLDGTTVDGNVQVEAGGALITVDAKIEGNVQAYGAAFIQISKTYVNGNIQIEATFGVFDHTPNLVCGSEVGGDIQLKNNLAPFVVGPCMMDEAGNAILGNLQVEDNYLAQDFDPGFDYDWAFDISENHVYGDLQFKNNRDYRSLQGHNIYRNTIDQNLQCFDNVPDPVGGENSVGGDAEGQCYALAG